MIENQTFEKLKTLAESAKYDVSCASSGVDKKNNGGIGNASAAGICHSWSSDGRCISLLKTLLTNDCVYDCSYCINRCSNDIRRESFTPDEIAKLTIEFYRRNYIEGLFLSSAIEKNPNYTMEKIVKLLLLLRNREGFNGYIHVKAIPGADKQLLNQAGQLADRMSVNLELPTEDSLKQLAPQKSFKTIVAPMEQIKQGIIEAKESKRVFRHAPSYVPGGQSTQIIVGATRDNDRSILMASERLYKRFEMKRVYYSAYVPVNKGGNLPAIHTAPPLLREHRLYQADWLLRFYKFEVKELLGDDQLNFDLDFDPKMNWALRNIGQFPVEINSASYNTLLRVPGIGVNSAMRIVKQRSAVRIHYEDLKKIGVVLKRARFFVTCQGKYYGERQLSAEVVKRSLNPKPKFQQLSLF